MAKKRDREQKDRTPRGEKAVSRRDSSRRELQASVQPFCRRWELL